MSVTLDEANKIVEAGKVKAKEVGVPMTIAVVDSHGDLVAFQRMDGATLRSVFIAQGKARASAYFGRPTSEMTQMADSPISRGLTLHFQGQFIPSQGAVPIMRGQEIRGAIGVSGGPSQQDEEVARAGLAAIQ